VKIFLSLCLISVAVVSNSFGADRVLTLAEARAIALTNNPRVSIADYRSAIAHEQMVEARSAFFPTITANATAASAADRDNTRIAAGGLNNPSIFERNAEGLVINQLITDFGRTANLTSSAKFRMRGEVENARATREEIVFAVDSAYFDALRARTLVNVATQTIATCQFLLSQVSALASNNLRSQLDVDFARVTYDEGRLLLTRAQNEQEAALARLTTILATTNRFDLVNEPISTSTLSTNVSDLVQLAFAERPELKRLRYEAEAARRFAKAEHALHYPTISAIGAAGVIPLRDENHLPLDNYVAGGVNLSLPIFAGGLHVARAEEASLRAKSAEESLRAAEDNISRDVRVALLNVQSAAERMLISAQLARHATDAFALAQARYQNGGASMVELSQAQMNKTAAEIEEITSRYEFQILQKRLSFEIGAAVGVAESR